MGEATREVFWQVHNLRPFYLLVTISLLVFLWGVVKGGLFVKGGAIPGTLRPVKLRITAFLADILMHRVFIKEKGARGWHFMVFSGFVILFFVTCWLMLSHYVNERLFQGVAYLITSLAAELAGLALLVGAVVGIFSSFREAKGKEEEKTLERRVVLLLLALVAWTGFLVEGFRLHLQGGNPWVGWSFGGGAVSWLFAAAEREYGVRLFRVFWWLHSILALGLIAWIPFSPGLRHMIFLAALRVQAPSEPRCPPSLPLLRQSFGDVWQPPSPVRLGVESAADTTAKQRLSLLACVECGYCEELCPAFQTEQPLSPRQYLRDLRGFVTRREGMPSRAGASGGHSAAEAVTRPALWACRLCLGCEELCPAGIEHVQGIMDIRRGEVLGHGLIPEEGAAVLRHLKRTGNPYGVSDEERESWIDRLEIPSSPAGNSEAFLLWTGCFQQGDEQKPRVLSALVELLKGLQVPFFIPRDLSPCCGDPARVLGEEDLFQSLAGEQIGVIREGGTTKILVHCPHCYTVLKDVYPDFGAELSVTHTSELLWDCLQENRLAIGTSSHKEALVYHDPCFLARYQGIHQAPRQILESLPGFHLVEPAHNRRRAFCCGAGGGHFFMDLDLQERPSSRRLREILEYDPKTLAVSCGFCFSMFDDALRLLPEESPLEVVDWLELLARAVRYP